MAKTFEHFMMKPIIDPVDKSLLVSELTQDKFLRPTNKAHNEIYIVTAHNSPNVMREIGRLRELSFRSGGGGTGEEIDTDEYDFMEVPYKQLIVWDPVSLEIIGGYRFLSGMEVGFYENGQPKFVMSHLFIFSDEFIKDYLPHTIELGRAFVQPDYQTSKMGMKSIFALDNLWDGLGALVHSIKKSKYFIGKVTLYEKYPVVARELIYEYLLKHFPDPDNLIRPKEIIKISAASTELAKTILTDSDLHTNYKYLQKAIRNEGEVIPPMFQSYIGLTDTMRTFGSIFDKDFGSVYETGILITMNDLLDSKKARYITPYIEYMKNILAQRRKAKKLEKEQKKIKKLESKKK